MLLSNFLSRDYIINLQELLFNLVATAMDVGCASPNGRHLNTLRCGSEILESPQIVGKRTSSVLHQRTHEQSKVIQQGTFFLQKWWARTQSHLMDTLSQKGLCLLSLKSMVTVAHPTGGHAAPQSDVIH